MAALFTVKTHRLLLDSLTLDDWPVVQAEWGVPEVARMTATVKSPWREADVKDWISARLDQSRDGFGCAIRLPDGRLIGSVGLGLSNSQANFGYMLGQAHWGQGYATEACHAFLSEAYRRFPDYGDIEAGVFDDNIGSAKVLCKLGFERVGQTDCKSHGRVEPAPSTLYRLQADQLKAIT